MNFKERYTDSYTVTKALAHYFSACTIAMCVALVNKDLLLLVIFYPIVLEAWQTFRNKKFKPADAAFDLLENFCGIMTAFLFVSIYEKIIM